jgi:hypothetical protein
MRFWRTGQHSHEKRGNRDADETPPDQPTEIVLHVGTFAAL